MVYRNLLDMHIHSDAHNAYNVGRKITDAYDMMKAAGFGYVTYYQKHQAVPIKLD